MNNYPEWQKTAREASKEHDNAVMLEQRAANAKKNEERTQKLREFLAEAGVGGEIIDGRFERDGYIITLYWNDRAEFHHVDFPYNIEYGPYWIPIPSLYINQPLNNIPFLVGDKFEEVDRVLEQLRSRESGKVVRSDEENDANAEIASLVRQLINLAQYREDY